jgi:hypothetical protein
MSHKVVKHTKIEISQDAESAMGDLPRRDRRLMRHLLKRVKRQSIFKVLQTPSLPATQTAFVKGELWLHALDSAIAFFRLEKAVLRLIGIISRAELYRLSEVIRTIEKLVIWEMEQQWQKSPVRHQHNSLRKFKTGTI